MTQQIVQVDAFTDQPFLGNPAAVCVLAEARDDDWMQNVAREMNLSETAFLRRENSGFSLRWFTPSTEVRLCGHATLASAHVLWEEGYLQEDEEARFHTLSGLLTARRVGNWIHMDFPAEPTQPEPAPSDLERLLGVPVLSFGRSARLGYALAEIGSEREVRRLQPDFARLRALPDIKGLIVTARASTPGFDFVSRFFAPALGVDEDPVTGSAHCCLGRYWSERLHKLDFQAYQASARGGIVQVLVERDRVILGGQAVTVMRGEFLY